MWVISSCNLTLVSSRKTKQVLPAPLAGLVRLHDVRGIQTHIRRVKNEN